jgi:hypothetical protein
MVWGVRTMVTSGSLNEEAGVRASEPRNFRDVYAGCFVFHDMVWGVGT